MRYLLVNGPNLNTLGMREPHIYGHDTLADIVSRVTQRAGELGVEVEAFQSNHEGAIIDYLQSNTGKADGLIINPGGLEPKGQNLYAETQASGTPNAGTPGQNGVGTLQQGFVETSNVNVVEELVSMIQTQRAYELNSKAIQTSDQMLQRLGQL